MTIGASSRSDVVSARLDEMRHRHRHWRAFTLRVVVLVVLTHALDDRKFARASSASIPADDATLDTLPAVEDASTKRRLRCNACVAAVDALREAMMTANAKRGSVGMGRVEANAVMDRACGEVSAEFGLQMRENRVTETFSTDARVSRARGRWITLYAQEACGRLVDDENDEKMYTLMREGKDSTEWRRVMCQVADGPCDSARSSEPGNAAPTVNLGARGEEL